MATFTVNLSPKPINLASEGSLDVVKDSSGNSIQREYFGIMIVNEDGKKIVGFVKDGKSFSDEITPSPSGYPFVFAEG
jgi:hypothetical protein